MKFSLKADVFLKIIKKKDFQSLPIRNKNGTTDGDKIVMKN